MLIKFKNSEKLFVTTPPVEAKLFDAQKKDTGWLFGTTLTVDGNVTSDYIDTLLTPESISEIIICNDDQSKKKTISGYQKVNHATIKYADDLSAFVDVQFMKLAETHINANEGSNDGK